MAVVIELYELKNICKDMAELGVAQYIRATSPAEDFISQREAYRMFGETRVKNWLRMGLITAQQNGTGKNSKRLYSKADLMATSKSESFNQIINR
ncbi:MAG: hypothetical protein ACI4TM_06665 [Candidatus Cryptobacteroides sp.]